MILGSQDHEMPLGSIARISQTGAEGGEGTGGHYHDFAGA